MNDRYLWDRTGEPDAEVQQLEEVLGTLRYQPRPLELPADVQPAPRRRFFPSLAIAATIALMVLAATIWLRFHRQPASRPGEIATTNNNQKRSTELSNAPPTNSPDESKPGSRDKESRVLIAHRDRAPRRSAVAQDANKSDRSIRRDEMTAMQRAEAEAAKDQLMLALRVASAKLNLAQRKTLTPPTTNNIHNQHKLG